MENIIKQGYLNCLMRGVANSGSMQRRYYILYGPTPNSQARLDYYENEAAFKKDPKCRKTIYLESVKHMTKQSDPERPNSFMLIMARGDSRTYHFVAASEFEMASWIRAIEQAQAEDQKLRATSPFSSVEENASILVDKNTIYEPAEEFQLFNVSIQETEAAKRCNLKIGSTYELYVLPENLCLVYHAMRLITWNYKHIRRYGCGDTNFTFEAGRKSLSGEGLFSFSVDNGTQLFRTVQDQMKHLQKQKTGDGDEFNRLLRGQPPSLPARNHSQSSEEDQAGPPVPERRSSGGSDTAPSNHVPNVPQLPPKPKVGIKLSQPGKGKGKPPLAEKGFDKPTHIAVLESAVQHELDSKLGVKPPMLKARGPPTPPIGPHVSERTSSALPKARSKADDRISTGEQYELAKSKLPHPGPHITPLNYTEASDSRVLEPNYVKHSAKNNKNEPDYAEYDVLGSLRYQSNGPGAGKQGAAASKEPYYDDMGSYSEAQFPDNSKAWAAKKVAAASDGIPPPLVMYDTPADAETTHAPSKMSGIIAQLNNVRTDPSPSEYDHIGNIKARPRATSADSSTYNIYCLPDNIH